MKAIGTIKIKGKEYTYEFKMKAVRLFMELYKLEYFPEYEKKIQEISAKSKNGMSMSGFYIFANLVLTGIQAFSDDPLNFGADEILDELLHDQDKINEITKVFVSSQERFKKTNSSVGSGKSKVGK